MGIKDEMSTTTSTKDDIARVGVGQGELYSPHHAVEINKSSTKLEDQQGEEQKMVMGVAADNIRRNFATIKERVLDKLRAAAVPADALENARHFLESVVRDVGVAAHGLTKDALLRIKTHLVDLLPSLSPNITRKMVDDAEEEANGKGDSEGEERREDTNGQKQDGHDHQPSSKALQQSRL
ncbi:uncharacterized protein LOC116112749 [Pistacia vera]|uniref:uncharacterized protein LOC116112749 n=1 Tax=Pistacia vera TaxID=55513 RepID=UPI0012633C4D|nr:uncharacterized protein LOC116112749 [Pistacia vera]